MKQVSRRLPHSSNASMLLLLVTLLGTADANIFKTNDKLRQAWPEIFPTRNRNAGGPQFFKWIYDHASSEQEFDEMNQLYCGVSGSVVRPNSRPDYVQIQRVDGSGVTCGLFYRCCWPCTCDIEKYSRAETMQFSMGGETFNREVLSIPDPCTQEGNIPRQVNTFTCQDGKTENAVQTGTPGRIVMAILGDADPQCRKGEYGGDSMLVRQCAQRNEMDSCQLSRRGGMGDIFAKLTCAADSDRAECQCNAGKWSGHKSPVLSKLVKSKASEEPSCGEGEVCSYKRELLARVLLADEEASDLMLAGHACCIALPFAGVLGYYFYRRKAQGVRIL